MSSTWQHDSKTQDRLYKMLHKLKSMARQVPPKYQPRLSYELLSSLAALLLDDTVLQIVAELTELQHMTERHLHQTRCALLARLRVERDDMVKSQKAIVEKARCGGRIHALPQLLASHGHDLQELDERQQRELQHCNNNILNIIDHKVAEQQSTLQQVGVPGFFPTNNPLDVRVQMYILNFIVKLSKNNPAVAYSCTS
uniref:Protein DGCR6-like n=1 Tax=Hirondellea gigas TaxID=1518452 RepID=A0A2P2I679_9CRUS